MQPLTYNKHTFIKAPITGNKWESLSNRPHFLWVNTGVINPQVILGGHSKKLVNHCLWLLICKFFSCSLTSQVSLLWL